MQSFAPMSPVDGPLPDDEGWVCQPKLDGHRGLVDGRDGLVVRSRRGNDLTGRFPALVGLSGCGMVLDGELVVYGADGRPAFHRVMGGSRQAAPNRFAYVVFDVMWVDGADVSGLAVQERLGVLSDRAGRLAAMGPVEVVPSGPPSAVWAAAVGAGLEGVVSKRVGSVYRPGRRHGDWRRTKHLVETVVEVTGWTVASGRPKELAVTTPAGYATTVFHGLDDRAWRQVLRRCVGVVVEVTDGRVRIGAGVRAVIRHHGDPGRIREPRFVGWADQEVT